MFVQSAENIACSPGLYDLSERSEGWLGDHIDLWGYETGLPAALDQLAMRDAPLDAEVWVRNLVPFVAGLFSRGPDLNRAQNNEMQIMASQEMLAPVMVSSADLGYLSRITVRDTPTTPLGIDHLV